MRSVLRKIWNAYRSRRLRRRALFQLQPVSRVFGLDRGLPIDRHYIERFLSEKRDVIRGRVLEIGDATYTRSFGGDRVQQSDVLHYDSSAPEATIVGDLLEEATLPANAFDCIILTQTLPFLGDPGRAADMAHRALAPHGVVLLTLPCISQISRYDMDRWGDFWRFTDRSARLLMERRFAPGDVEVQVYGNALSACCFLQGFAAGELNENELNYADADYPVTIAVAARKPGPGNAIDVR